MNLAQELKETADRWHSSQPEIPKELLDLMKKAAENGAYSLCWYKGLSPEVRQRLKGEQIAVSDECVFNEEYYKLSWK